jgi:hypothetical protein
LSGRTDGQQGMARVGVQATAPAVADTPDEGSPPRRMPRAGSGANVINAAGTHGQSPARLARMTVLWACPVIDPLTEHLESDEEDWA